MRCIRIAIRRAGSWPCRTPWRARRHSPAAMGTATRRPWASMQMGAYMTALADVLPELEARAYERWRDEGTDLYNQFQLTQGLDATGYDRYRDTVGDYYNDLGYAYGKWQDLYGNDYNQYLNALAAWQDDRNFAYQQAMDALAQQNSRAGIRLSAAAGCEKKLGQRRRKRAAGAAVAAVCRNPISIISRSR